MRHFDCETTTAPAPAKTHAAIPRGRGWRLALAFALGAFVVPACAWPQKNALRYPHARATAARRAPAHQAALSAWLRARLQKLDPALHVGVHVVSAEDGGEIFSHNAGERFVPASTVKMLTAATALDVLGPAFRFNTELWADGYDRESKSVRNLYLRGSGDPSLDVGDLAALIATLRQAGVTRIVGEVVVDDTAFDAVPWGRGWMWDDLGEGYSAPVSALNVAGNALSLWVAPGPRPGVAARVFLQPATRFVTLGNVVNTAPVGSPAAVRLFLGGGESVLEGPPLAADPQLVGFGAPPAPVFSATDLALMAGHQLTVGGGIAADAGPRLRRLAVRDAAAWVATLLREQLLAQRLEVPPNWRRGATPATATLMATHASAALGGLLPGYVKASNNHAMECLLKRVGAQTAGGPGSFATGIAAVRRFLEAELGMDGTTAVLFDGSGASRYDLLTPAQLTRVTLAASRRFSSGPEFVASLPIGGVDGTLGHRMRATALRGQVRAKTGTMTGVSALAGLLNAEDDEPLVFAIMADHATCGAQALRELQDELLTLLRRPPTPSTATLAAPAATR